MYLWVHCRAYSSGLAITLVHPKFTSSPSDGLTPLSTAKSFGPTYRRIFTGAAAVLPAAIDATGSDSCLPLTVTLCHCVQSHSERSLPSGMKVAAKNVS